ncbi:MULTISPECIES: class I SAM-dependent DNA methyltransferase [Aerosakkonema]|uniref:class I SAM-dependent DNA methyltransferase n=1 Tax=Aerosakkonema TaxID=1246629 RepID=UPI0035B786FD
MSLATVYNAYNPFARIYNEYWAADIAKKTIPPLEKLLIPHIPERARIIDLCCGSGQVTQQLLKRGYQLTGIDGSEEMLDYARKNAPSGEFLLDDARFFKQPPTFHAVISTTGSLNYVMNLEELTSVFRNVYAALLENGLFVFNVYLEAEYQSDWNGSMSGDIKDDYAWAVRQIYDPENKIGELKVTIFQLVEGNWQRTDTTIQEKCYSSAEIQYALENVGFTEVSVYDAERELGVERSTGNTYFVCRKSLSKYS